MTYQGIVQNGAVVLEGNANLPDGTIVSVVPIAASDVQVARGSDSPTIWQKLAELGRWAETQETKLPSDLAENHDRTIGQKLAELAKKYENLPCDLPEDLAMNHDHYLHGQPIVKELATESQDRLRTLIQEGTSSPDIPAEEAATRLRQFAQNLAQGRE